MTKAEKMIILVERFEMKRICLALREKGWQLSSGIGDKNKVQLKFSKIPNKPFSSNIVDILEQMYGYL